MASATPGTPMPNLATNHTSSAMFSTVDSSRNARADTESPRPRRMPERML